MIFPLLLLVPTLIALVMEMYVPLPIKLMCDPRVAIRVKLVEMWVLGLLYTKITLRLPVFEALRRMNERIQRVRVGFLALQIRSNGWTAHRLTVTGDVTHAP
jgi:E3 ubiquitin-protein ligase MARCH6